MNFDKAPEEKIIYDPLCLSYDQINELTETDIFNTLSKMANELSGSQSHLEATKEEKQVLRELRNNIIYKKYLEKLNKIIDMFLIEINSDKVKNVGIMKDARLFIKLTKYLQENPNMSEEDARTKITKAIEYFNNKNKRIA